MADTLLHHPDHPAGDPAEAGFDAVALDRELVAMVTRDAARAPRWNPEVGTIAPGKVADLMVLRPPPDSPTSGAVASPYRALIDATEREVQLVMVGGVALAGDAGLMQQLKPGDHELLQSARGGFTKAVDEPTQQFPRVSSGWTRSATRSGPRWPPSEATPQHRVRPPDAQVVVHQGTRREGPGGEPPMRRSPSASSFRGSGQAAW